jgi:hypothetical protein
MRTDGIVQRGTAVVEFFAKVGSTFENQKRMREGVIANRVSGIDEFANEIGTLTNVASNTKKCRLHLMARENFE